MHPPIRVHALSNCLPTSCDNFGRRPQRRLKHEPDDARKTLLASITFATDSRYSSKQQRLQSQLFELESCFALVILKWVLADHRITQLLCSHLTCRESKVRGLVKKILEDPEAGWTLPICGKNKTSMATTDNNGCIRHTFWSLGVETSVSPLGMYWTLPMSTKKVQDCKQPTVFVQTLKVLKVVHNCAIVADALQHQHTCLALGDKGFARLQSHISTVYIHFLNSKPIEPYHILVLLWRHIRVTTILPL